MTRIGKIQRVIRGVPGPIPIVLPKKNPVSVPAKPIHVPNWPTSVPASVPTTPTKAPAKRETER